MNNQQPFAGSTEESATEIIYHNKSINYKMNFPNLTIPNLYILGINDFISGRFHDQDELTKMRKNEQHKSNSATD